MTLLELTKELGLDPRRVSSTGGGEYHSSCPSCLGIDRFIIQPNNQQKNCIGSYWCRKCGIHGDAIEFARRFFRLSFDDAVKRVGGHVDSTSFLFKRSFVKPALKAPPKEWSEKAATFVECATAEILKREDIIGMLDNRGLDWEAILKYKIGYCQQELLISRSDWGLQVEHRENGSERKLWLPQGIVIPSLEKNGAVVRLKIRRDKWREGDKLPKYVAISGSMGGLGIIGDVNKELMVVLESELDAFTLCHACGDFLFCVAIGSNNKEPDNVVDYYAQLKKVIVCHDNDEGGEVMRKKWTRLYPHACSLPTPRGKDIGEAVQQGLDLRTWILENNKR